MVRLSDFENEDDLIKRLKAINKILRSPNVSVIERYAAVAELALMKNTDRMGVGLLTRGLFDDTNHQIRKMAADALVTYGLRDTTDAFLPLIKDGRAGLKRILNKHPDELNICLKRLKPLFQQKWLSGRGTIDYGLRHALVILENLGRWLGSQSLDDIEEDNESIFLESDSSQLAQLDEEAHTARSFKEWLEDQDRRWILELVQQVLENSVDIFCRRDAMKVLGELVPDLNSDHCKSTYTLIRQAIDHPQNRHDYRVTWDGLRALTAITQHYPEYMDQFCQDLLAIFRDRTYILGKTDLEEAHRYITRFHCIEALGALQLYEPLKSLTEGSQADHSKFSMMTFTQRAGRSNNAMNLMKRGYLRAFKHIYFAENQASPNQITERQEDILSHIRKWTASKEKKVREEALDFFKRLPNITLALQHLLEGARENDALFALANSNEKMEELLEQRKQFAIVLRNVLTKLHTYDLQAEQIQQQVIQLLRDWALHPVIVKENEAHSSKVARIEALWALYHCDSQLQAGLLQEETYGVWQQQLADLLENEHNPAVLSILHLFFALYVKSPQTTKDQLRIIAHAAEYHKQVRVCAEMELLIRTEQVIEDLSDDLMTFLPGHINTGTDTEIHYSLVERFLLRLAVFNTERASHLIEDLLRLDYRFPEAFVQSLREKLSPYHCNFENNRNLFFNRVLRDLPLRHTDLGCLNLRLDYLNLLRAGMVQSPTKERALKKLASSNEEITPLARHVQVGLQSIASQFDEYTLPVLFSSEDPKVPIPTKDTECVVILPGLNETTNCAILYTSLSQKAHQQNLKGYLNIENYHPKALLFLNRAKTDEEIAWILRKHANQLPTQAGQVEKLDILLVGKITLAQDDGVSVDVGLQKPIFVSQQQMLGLDANTLDPDAWHQYAHQNVGVSMLFRIRTITFCQNGRNEEIQHMELERDFSIAQLKTPTIEAELRQVEASDMRNPSVLFRALGSDIRVSLRELSWQNQEGWLRGGGWQKWFENHIGHRYELIRKKSTAGKLYWSLREKEATFENFLQLLYKQGSNQFILTYVGLEEGKGYIFEVSPGENCYIPADRLGYVEDEQFRFLLPNTTPEIGNQLPVRFKIIELHGEPQAILSLDGKIDTNKFSAEQYPRGMLITGELSYSDDSYLKGSGKVKVEGPLAQATVLIHRLPTKADEKILSGAQVSGYVIDSDPYKNQLVLEFMHKPSEELVEDKIYYCRVVSPPEMVEYKMLIRHAHVTGELYERDMTYRHTPVLKEYCRKHRTQNTLLPARLSSAQQWQLVYKQAATALQRREVLAGLRITDSNKLDGISIWGDVISVYHDNITAVQKDGAIERVFHLSLNHFSFEKSPPKIYVGNRITISYSTRQAKDFTLTIDRATAHFSMLPDPFQAETWTALDEALPTDVSRKCVYVGRFGSYHLIETEPGVVFSLPTKMIEGGTPWFTNELGRWSLRDEPWRGQSGGAYAEVHWAQTQTAQGYPVHPGDFLTLIQPHDGRILLQSYTPGPLHFAFKPALFANHQDLEPWMQQADKDAPLQLKAKVLPFNKKGGRMVELLYIHAGDKNILLRNRIQAFFPNVVVGTQQGQSFIEAESSEIEVVLSAPPDLFKSQLSLRVKSYETTLDTEKHAAVVSLSDMLDELHPYEEVNGTIVYYERKRSAFRVNITALNNFPEHSCWLPVDEISFSLERSYNYAEALSEEQPDEFTIVSIDKVRGEIIVSLRDNPRQDVESVAREEHWHDGQRLDSVTYIGLEDQAGAVTAENMPDTVALQQEVNATQDIAVRASQLISLELRPGVHVTLPLQQFHQERAHNLQPGDQITVRVSEQEHCPIELHVVWFRQATFNLLRDPHRIVHARVGELTKGKYSLELLDHRRSLANVYLALDEEQMESLSHAQLSSYDLFRFSSSDFRKRELSFSPVQRLQKFDLLTVTYREVTGDQGIYVTYGQARQGFVYRSHISYDPDFDHLKFKPETDKKVFAARVIREADDTRDVMLSIKDAYVYPISHLKEIGGQQEADENHWFAVLANRQGASVDLQFYVGTVIHIPFSRISNLERLQNARPGDKVEFRIEANKSYSNVYIVNVIKSFLHAIQPKTLVKAYFQRRENEQRWRFVLPEYSYHDGVLLNRAELLPDILRDDLYLAIDRLPGSPTDPIPLRLREIDDRQQVIRIERTEPGRIWVRCEDGQEQWISMQFVTYRINNKTSYIEQTLAPGSILLATQEKYLSLTLNSSRPITLVSLYRYRGRTETELTYVQSENDGEYHLFEAQPGLFVRISASALLFYGYPFLKLERALVGDVFTVHCEAITFGEQEQIQVQVHNIRPSVLRSLRPNQIIHAEVKRVVAGGVIISADSANLSEEFVRKDNLFPRSTPLTEKSLIWLRVAQIDPEKRKLILTERLLPSFEELGRSGNVRSLLLYGDINQRTDRSIILEIEGQPIPIPLSALSWSQAETVADILPDDVHGLWVTVTMDRDKLRASHRDFLAPQLAAHFKINDVIAARVLARPHDQQRSIKSVLLDVEGVFVQLAQTEIVWGLPPNVNGLKPDTWLLVVVERVPEPGNPQSSPVVRVRAVNTLLDDIAVETEFKAYVRYTLEHGLVFSYSGVLGYVANEAIAWSSVIKAADLFQPGDPIRVYKGSNKTFSLKSRSQLNRLKEKDEVDAQILRITDQGCYLKLTNLGTTDIWIFLRHDQTQTLLNREPGSLHTFQVKKIDKETLRLDLKLVDELTIKSVDSSTSEKIILESHEVAYMTSFERFKRELRDERYVSLLKPGLMAGIAKKGGGPIGVPRNVPVENSQEKSARKRLMEALQPGNIACTYRTTRRLLGLLWKSTDSHFWQGLASRHVQAGEHYSLFHVLNRVAFALNQQQDEPEIEKDDDKDDLQIMQLESIIHYAIGITALFPPQSHGFTISPFEALRQLLLAYRYNKTVDIEIALMLVYNKLGFFELRRKFLEAIIQRFVRNLDWLLIIPQPIKLKETDYFRGEKDFIRRRDGKEALHEINTVLNWLSEGDRIKEAERRLMIIGQRLESSRIASLTGLLPALRFNQALCCTFLLEVDQALDLLKQCASALDDEQRKSGTSPSALSAIREGIYQLTMYLYYHQEDFKQFQDFTASHYSLSTSASSKTWLGYMFFAAGYKQLSQDLIERENYSSPEALLLSLYWQDAQQSTPTELKDCSSLEDMLFHNLILTNQWNEIRPGFRFLPGPAITSREKLDAVQIYQARNYFLQQYIDDPSTQVKNNHFIIENGLYTGRIADISNLLYGNVTHYIEQKSGSLIERWLKSPYERDTISTNFITLIQEQLDATFEELYVHYWTKPALRNQLWSVFDHNMDYGWLIHYLPKTISLNVLDALEDIVFHLLMVGLKQDALHLIDTCECKDENAVDALAYLSLLRELCEKEISASFRLLLKNLLSLSQKPYQPGLAERLTDCALTIEATNFLLRYPDVRRQTPMYILLGELQEREEQYEQAAVYYQLQAITAKNGIVAKKYKLSSALRLLRLHMLHPQIDGPEITGWYEADQLLGSLQEVFDKDRAEQEYRSCIEVLDRFYMLTENLDEQGNIDQDKFEDFLAQAEQLFSHMCSVWPLRDCLLSLYEMFIGTNALKCWSASQIWCILCLFIDYGFFTRTDQALEEPVDEMLNNTILNYEGKAIPDNKRVVAELESHKRNFFALQTWLSSHRLSRAPENIESGALAVRAFLTTRGKACLSIQKFHKATRQIVAELGSSHPAYGPATRQLIKQAERESII